MDPHLCRHGSWLDAERLAGRGERSGVLAIDQLHQRLHIHADEMLHAKMQSGENPTASSMAGLRVIRDNLVETLQRYVEQL
jgi:hypothetical protein